jgi:hypothetical protein
MCQNVKLEILMEIINRLLLELQTEVGITINSLVFFSRKSCL